MIDGHVHGTKTTGNKRLKSHLRCSVFLAEIPALLNNGVRIPPTLLQTPPAGRQQFPCDLFITFSLHDLYWLQNILVFKSKS